MFNRVYPPEMTDDLKQLISALTPLVDRLADRVAIRVADVLVTRAVAEPPPETFAPGVLVDKRTAARAIGTSQATLDRLVHEGAPVHVVATRRRFEISELRGWLAARGKRRTVAKPKRRDADDILLDQQVDEIARAAGLRRVDQG